MAKKIIAGAASWAFIVMWVGVANAQSNQDLHESLATTRAQLEALQKKVVELEAQLNQPQSTPIVSVQNRQTSDITNLEERVDELEVIALETDERVGSRAIVNAFDSIELDIGGFFDAAATIAIGEGNTEASFNRQVFELLAKAQLGEDWEFFVAQAFVRNAPLVFTDTESRTDPTFNNNNSPVATDTVIAWGQYHHSDALNIQFGRFVTPHGIVNIEHFPASLLDTEQPQFLRPFPGQTVFANFTNGVNIHGSKFLGKSTLTYAAYGGVWAGNSTSINFGGRLAYQVSDTGLTIGANAMSGDRSSMTSDDRFYGGGIDILFDKGPVLWKSEIFATSEDAGSNRLAWYTQPAIRLSDLWTVLYRYDFLDNGAIGGKAVEHVGGIVFDPISNVRLRLLYRNQQRKSDIGFEDATTDVLQVGTTLNF